MTSPFSATGLRQRLWRRPFSIAETLRVRLWRRPLGEGRRGDATRSDF
ncbi:MAG: hypothetical protein KME30_16520 [Iphinoe sp. HA4291-MV1]|nr:hypothetical protein [Iphinoe sp. HA4291-MV1]